VSKQGKSSQQTPPPRICVPNSERALFMVESDKFVGVIQRISATGGSAILSKGPIAPGTLGEMALRTVFEPVRAEIQFLHGVADGIPLALGDQFIRGLGRRKGADATESNQEKQETTHRSRLLSMTD